MPGEIAENVPVSDPNYRFYVQTYSLEVISAVKWRIEDLSHSKSHALLKNIFWFSTTCLKKTQEDLDTLLNNAFQKCCEIHNKFIDPVDVRKCCIQFSKIFLHFELVILGF